MVLLLVLLAACSGGGTKAAAPTTTQSSIVVPSTTSAPASCPTSFKVGDANSAAPSCWPKMLEAVLVNENVKTYDSKLATTQAPAICQEFTGRPAGIAQAGILTSWEDGTTPSPVPNKADRTLFLVAVVAVYCPQYFTSLK